MGVAAYNRGSASIARQIQARVRPVEFEVIDRLNALPKHDNAPTPWGEIQFTPGHGGWWAECPVTGFGYWYKTLREAVRSWNVEIYAYQLGIWIARPVKP